MIIHIKEASKEKFRAFDFELNCSYIVTAMYYFRDETKSGFRYLTNANYAKQGGLPVAFDDEDIDIIDGYIPAHWVAVKQNDSSSSAKTIVTFPEWAHDTRFYENMDDNEQDRMRAMNLYIEELKQLCDHYKGEHFGNISLEPFAK